MKHAAAYSAKRLTVAAVPALFDYTSAMPESDK